jgi:hypothetical protein
MHTLHHSTPHSLDTHIQLSPQHPTFTHTLAIGVACLVYQRLLVNSYCTSDLCRPRRLARPPSASRRTFGHSKMSDPTDTWFPRPSTPPDTRRHKDDTHHGLLRPRAYSPLAHIRMPQFPGNSSCKLRVVRSLRAAPASCAWCDEEEPQHTSFLLITVPDWTFINMYTHDRDPRDPSIEGFQDRQAHGPNLSSESIST